MKKILVIGKTGQLANEIKRISSEDPKIEFEFYGRDLLDLGDESSIQKTFSRFKKRQFSAVINAAAYTKVDQAESERDLAMQINAKSPEIIAKYSLDLEFKFVHLSTDFVFDGSKSVPYREDDSKGPLSVYGESKSLGEELVLKANKESVILRTSWVYSNFGKNFYLTISRLANEKKEISVIADQIGTPTSAKDLASVSLEAAQSNLQGLYHFSNEGCASWYDFAEEIVRLKGYECKVNPIPSINYPTPAKRPHFSVLSKEKFRRDFQFSNRHWKEGLLEVVGELSSK